MNLLSSVLLYTFTHFTPLLTIKSVFYVLLGYSSQLLFCEIDFELPVIEAYIRRWIKVLVKLYNGAIMSNFPVVKKSNERQYTFYQLSNFFKNRPTPVVSRSATFWHCTAVFSSDVTGIKHCTRICITFSCGQTDLILSSLVSWF